MQYLIDQDITQLNINKLKLGTLSEVFNSLCYRVTNVIYRTVLLDYILIL